MVKRKAVPAGKQRVVVETGIYRKVNGKYLAQYRDPGRRQHWKEFKTLDAARKWRARAIKDPTSIASGKRTLQAVWETYLAHHGESLKRTTRANWQQEWRAHIEPALGSWPVGRITVLSVKDFLADLERCGVGAATRQKCRSILHRVLQEAVENGELATNPAAAPGTRVKLPQPKKARILTPVELASLVEAAGRVGSPSDALAIETMFFLGLRVGEMAGLQARDIDAAAEEITIQRTVTDVGGKLEVQDATKANRYRVLPVAADLPVWDKLLQHLQAKGLIGKAQVFSAPGGGVIRPNNWRRRVWNRAMDEASVQDPPTPHSGRRTTASLLSSAGVPQATIQAILGHATLQQTGEYIHVSKAEMQVGFEKLAALSSPPDGPSGSRPHTFLVREGQPK